MTHVAEECPKHLPPFRRALSLLIPPTIRNRQLGGTLSLKQSRWIFQDPSFCLRRIVRNFPSVKIGWPPALGVQVAVQMPRTNAQSPASVVSSVLTAMLQEDRSSACLFRARISASPRTAGTRPASVKRTSIIWAPRWS